MLTLHFSCEITGVIIEHTFEFVVEYHFNAIYMFKLISGFRYAHAGHRRNLLSQPVQADIENEVEHVMISDPENLDILYNIDIKD